MPAIRPLASLLSKFADSSTVAELANAANIAIVQVTATVPPNGVAAIEFALLFPVMLMLYFCVAELTVGMMAHLAPVVGRPGGSDPCRRQARVGHRRGAGRGPGGGR